jgi:hypothetical protein
MAGVGASEPMGSSPERGRMTKGKRRQGCGLGAAWGGGAPWEAEAGACLVWTCCCYVPSGASC